MDSPLVDGLGADSLDFVDILFQIDKKFGVKIRPQELNFLSTLDIASPGPIKEGFLPADVIAKLEPWLPALKTVEDRDHITAAKLFSLISVETFVILIEKKLTEKSAGADVKSAAV